MDRLGIQAELFLKALFLFAQVPSWDDDLLTDPWQPVVVISVAG